ncbi:MAG: TetR/AcrR family transcriptional regulator [Actinomycetota bacterium]
MTVEVERRGPREATLELVLTAAFRLLIDEGAHAITAQRIHQETGIARTTIYRHWPEPADLIRTMFDRAVAGRGIPAFTGDLRSDLQIAVDSLVQRFNRRPVRALFGALVEHGRRDADAGDIAADYVRGLLTPVRHAVDAGIERGELVDGDVDGMVDELSATLFMRHVLLGEQVDDDDASRAVESFLQRHAVRR